MFEQQIEVVQRFAERAKQFDFVEAVAVSGSIRNGFGTENSDVDTYVYITRDITMQERDQIVLPDAIERERNDYWGASDNFTDAVTGVEIDCMYLQTSFMQDQVERVLIRHEAQMGYSTAFWHTVKQSLLIYDRATWFSDLQQLSQQPYPDALADNIISLNLPLLADIATSYHAQIEKAIKRSDRISLNHRLTAFLASYFDILFAINRTPHPGEKRLLAFARQCNIQPENMESDLTGLLQSVSTPSEKTLNTIDSLVMNLKKLVE